MSQNNDVPDNTKPTNKGNQQKRPFRRSLFGGMLGGVLSTLLFIGLFFYNGLVNVGGDATHTNVDSDANDSIPATTVTSDDNTELNIADISEAIVGVINVQKQSVWMESEDANVGSGIIYKKENDKAYIVTNYHVVKDAEDLEVNINQDKRVQAKVLGTDELSDLAVLEISGEHVDYVAELGNSKDSDIGDTVYAIGNPLGLNFSGSVTKGIISGLDRSVEVDTSGQNRSPDWEMQVIQTDAAINPGNSGGALVNSKGKVIGINSMKVAQATVEGIGFAIPIDTALPIMEELENDGEVARPVIGIAAVALSEVPAQYHHKVIVPDSVDGGIVIANVEDDSSAELAGLQQFDLITKINDKDIKSMLDLRKYLYLETTIGDSVHLEVYRAGEKLNISLELIE